MTDIIKIPTTNLRFSTTASSKRVFLGDSNITDNRKWPTRPEILISLDL